MPHPPSLDDFYPRIRREELEDFANVNFRRAVRKTAVAEHSAERLTPGDGLDHGIWYILVKAGDQIAVVVGMYSTTFNLLGGIWKRQG